MRRVLLAAVAVGALLAMSVFSASAVVPIPVATELSEAYPGGVFVQPVRVAGEVRGEWTTVACHIHVFTTVDGVGEVMAADDGSSSVFTPVNPVLVGGSELVAGRAVFTVDPGVTITTTNTDVEASGTCPVNTPD